MEGYYRSTNHSAQGKQKSAKIEKKVQGDFSLLGETNGFFLQFCNVEIESQSVHLLHCADTPFWSTEGAWKICTLTDYLSPPTYRQLPYFISEPEPEGCIWFWLQLCRLAVIFDFFSAEKPREKGREILFIFWRDLFHAITLKYKRHKHTNTRTHWSMASLSWSKKTNK